MFHLTQTQLLQLRRISLRRAEILDTCGSGLEIPEKDFEFLLVGQQCLTLFDEMLRSQTAYVHGGGTRNAWQDMRLTFVNFKSFLATVPLC